MEKITTPDFDFSYLKLAPIISLGYLVLFKFIGPSISRLVTSSYSSLSVHDQAEWNSRIMSTVNAASTAVLGVYALLFGDGMDHMQLWNDNNVAKVTITMVVAYSVADLIVMLVWCKLGTQDTVLYCVHHLVALYGGVIMPGYGVLLYFAMVRILAECSTPFTNQRWFFDISGYPRTKPVVVANGTLMLLSFFLVRMVPMPVFWYQWFKVAGSEPATRLVHIKYIVYQCAVWDCLNFFWFYKMCRGYANAIMAMTNGKRTASKRA